MTTDILIAALFFILGLIPAYYFYKKSIRIKEPVYSIRSSNIISETFTDLVVSYRGREIERFTFSTILFFNRGAMAIDGNDISSRRPLRIVPKDCNILEATVLIYNNPSNGITLNADEEQGGYRIDFEYLNQDDGAILVILHDGISSENLDVVGDMKEVRSLRRIPPGWLKAASPPDPVNNVVSIVIVFLGVMSALALLLPISETVRDWFRVGLVYFSCLAIAPVVGLVVSLVRRSRRVVIPKGLESFDQ
jgi:hypothetical protein